VRVGIPVDAVQVLPQDVAEQATDEAA